MILSHHRSGSNFLCNLLYANDKITCLNEPLSMHTDFFKQEDLVEWNAEEYDEKYLHLSLKENELLIEYLKDLKNYMTDESNGKITGFKETLLFEKLTWLKEFMPDLKIVYLVRDPRAVINSVLRNDMYKIWNYDVTVAGYIKKYHLEKEYEIDINNPIHLAVWSWKIRHNLFMKNKDLFVNKIVKLEDIVYEPDKTAGEIMGFLGTDLTEAQKDFLAKVYGDKKKGKSFSVFTTKERVLDDWKNRISDVDEEYIERTLHREMEEFGYL